MSRAAAQKGIFIVSGSEEGCRRAQLSQSLRKIKIATKALVRYRRCRWEGIQTIRDSKYRRRGRVTMRMERRAKGEVSRIRWNKDRKEKAEL